MATRISFRWLGAAGIELAAAGEVLLVDPYFTRIPFRRLWLGRIQPDRSLIARMVYRADAVLVTHSHFDHLMDVPEVMRKTGALAYGSFNTCRLLAIFEVPASKMHEIKTGDRLTHGSFQLEVFQAAHVRVPGFGTRSLPAHMQPPLSARNYCMDTSFCFLIQVDGLRISTSPGIVPEHAVPADILCTLPIQEYGYCESLLQRVKPRVVIPIHWDDLFQPLAKQIRPCFGMPRLGFPPLRRIDLAEYAKVVQQIAPGTAVIVPEINRVLDLNALIHD